MTSERPDDYDDPGASEGMCDCGKCPWEMCDCGEFFLNWVCGMHTDGQCSLAGTEECDFECPHMASVRRASRSSGAAR